jgi:type 1 glutamine amidotransferase
LYSSISTSAGAAYGQQFDVLVFSKTLGFRHSSIPFGITMIQNLASANNFTATFTEDSNTFTAANLAQYEVVVFLNTTGDVLDTNQQNAFKSYIESGKGFVGIHSASDTLHSWSWYGNLVGAFFVDHPAGTDPLRSKAALVRVKVTV